MQATLDRVSTINERLAELDARIARCERMGDPRRAEDYRIAADPMRAELARLVESN